MTKNDTEDMIKYLSLNPDEMLEWEPFCGRGVSESDKISPTNKVSMAGISHHPKLED